MKNVNVDKLESVLSKHFKGQKVTMEMISYGSYGGFTFSARVEPTIKENPMKAGKDKKT